MNFSSRQDQLFTNSKGLLTFSNAVSPKNDALSADTFDEVVAFSNFFCSSYSLFFFPFEKLQRLAFYCRVLGLPVVKQFRRFRNFVG